MENELTLHVMFLSPTTNAQDVRENINLVTEDLVDKTMTLNAYTEMGIEKEQSYLENMKIIRSDRTVVTGFAAQKVIYTATATSIPMKFEQVWFLENGTAHVWTFADSADMFEQHVGLFEHMLDTLTVK